MEENTSTFARPQDMQKLDAQIQVANAMSQSLLFTLGRQYLDIPFEDATHIQPIFPREESLEKPNFLRVEQVGSSVVGSLQQPFTALQTALSACHVPRRYTLMFIVSSDGKQNHVYLGARSHNHYDDSQDFVENLGHFLQGNWPGTRLQVCTSEDEEFKTHLQLPLTKKLGYVTALTGIPSLKPGDNPGYPQSLDRLLAGLRGSQFMYAVIAEPMAETEINTIIYNLRELMGRVHMLTKTTLTETLSVGTSESEQISQTSGRSYSHQEGENSGSTTEGGLDLKVVAGTLAKIFPPAGLMSSVLALGGIAFGPSLSFSKNKQKSFSDTYTTSNSSTWGKTTGFNLSQAQAFGREYINVHAQAAANLIQKYIERFEQARALGCWNVGVYLLTENPYVSERAAIQLRSLLSGEKSIFEPIRIHDLKRLWSYHTENLTNDNPVKKAQNALKDFNQPSLTLVNPQTKKQLDHPLGFAFNGLTTPLNTEELTLLVNLPRREVPGLRVMPTADFSLNPPEIAEHDITLGHLLEGGESTSLNYGLSLKTLAKHALVTGITGTGKSTTCQTLLTELHKRHIPFLVIEPAKEEYVEWAIQRNESLPKDSPDRIAIYMPGMQTWRGHKLEDQLTLNPFDIVWLSSKTTPQILSHIDRLKSILTAAFPMQEVLPILLEDVLFYAYGRPQNWLADQLPPFETSRPTLSQLLDQVSLVIKGKGYEDRITANMTAALTTRIQSLRRGWKKQLFDQPQSTPWKQIFDRPAVINLAHLGDDADKAFAMAILLQFLYEYRQAQNELLTSEERRDNRLRHLTVIEEAHRILLKVASGSVEQANPQAKVAEMFANILSEIRAYGQGLMIVDQVPARLVPDAIKNTNLKIVHRLVAADDRDAMSACMALTPEQSAIINRLRPGQAIVCGEQDDMAAWVQILKN